MTELSRGSLDHSLPGRGPDKWATSLAIQQMLINIQEETFIVWLTRLTERFFKQKYSVRMTRKRHSLILLVGIETTADSLDGSSVSHVNEYLLDPTDLSPKILRVPQATLRMLHYLIQHTACLALSWVLGIRR